MDIDKVKYELKWEPKIGMREGLTDIIDWVIKNEDKLRLGLPIGSLNTLGRGCTSQLFKDSDYNIIGYEPGNERADLLVIKKHISWP